MFTTAPPSLLTYTGVTELSQYRALQSSYKTEQMLNGQTRKVPVREADYLKRAGYRLAVISPCTCICLLTSQHAV